MRRGGLINCRAWLSLSLREKVLPLNGARLGAFRVAVRAGWLRRFAPHPSRRVEYSATPPHDAQIGYGAGFWTNRGISPGALRRVASGLPANSFFAQGLWGQIIVVVPDDRLVMARFGWSNGEVADIYRSIADIVAAVRALPR